jgi:uncharacterized protein
MNDIPLSLEIQHQIVDSLKMFDPHKIILFGSYAYGKPNSESDIDLVFINRDEVYKSFQERIEMKIEILKKLDALTQPLDILAYTKKEWDDLVAKNSSFIREINQKGVVLEAVA